jgi:hypothetical protein
MEPNPSFEDLNDTELVALARFNDIRGAGRAVPRDTLIQALQSYTDIPTHSPLDWLRADMSAWLKDGWKKRSFQLQALSNRCPNCWASTDLQALACHHSNEEKIRIWKATSPPA